MKAFTFDFDGTLADSATCSILATQEAFKLSGLTPPDSNQVLHYMGIPIEQSFKEMSTEPLCEEDFEQLLTLFRSTYKKMEQVTLRSFENMHNVLEGLSQRGIQLFVVSSKKTDVLYRNLQSLQLDKYFTDWIGSDQVTYYKPHPDGIHTILKRYGLQPHACIMIGDAIFDIEMGHAAGCRTCAVAWGSHSVTSLQQVKPTYLVMETRELLTI